MINEILFMNGYGAYVWSSFIFTLIGFFILYSAIIFQLIISTGLFPVIALISLAIQRAFLSDELDAS